MSPSSKAAGQGDLGRVSDPAGASTKDAAPNLATREKPARLSATSRSSLGINLATVVDWSTEYPFLDLMKWSRGWKDWDKKDLGVGTVDDRGWITALAPGKVAGSVFLTNHNDTPIPYTRYVVRWTGTGRISYRWAARKVGAAHGGDLIEVGPDSCLLQLDHVDPKDPIRDITIVPEEHVEAFDQGAVFNPDFLARIEGFRALRFMHWMRTDREANHRSWDERPVPQDRDYGRKGVPVEVMVDLANNVGADPWFNMPHWSDDAYIAGFAKLVHDRLKPGLTAYVEHSNEVWNRHYSQQKYAQEKARERWQKNSAQAGMQWHGMRTAHVCDIWKKQAFSDEPGRVHCTMGTQRGWPGLESAVMDCPLWVAEGNEPCHRHGIDSLAVAAYFNGCLHGKDTVDLVSTWFGDPDGGMTRGIEQAGEGRHLECEATVAGLEASYAYFKKVAGKRGLALVAYEGGQHITGNGRRIQDDLRFTAYYTRLNRDPRMKDLHLQNLANWKQQGGTLFMHYSDIVRPSKWGSFGALEQVKQESSPKWEALLEFGQTPCWWPGC